MMKKTAALYVRLSQEDEKKAMSESIQNQIAFLTEYILKKGWQKGEIYCDDGFSGLDFERPAFQKMLEDIEKGKVNCIVVKDLSRLGRDYIGTGYLLERYFPQKGVQLIAVNDDIDTMSEENQQQWLPFRTVLNDLYAKDISKKIRTSFDIKRKNGQFIGAFSPYGYQKDSKNKNKLVIEEETAEIVKKIFQWYLQGDSMTGIAKKLNSMAVPSPAVYKMIHSSYANKNIKYGLWTQQTIKSILSNETYIGNLTQGKTKKVSYKIDKSKKIDKQNWIVAENSHNAIIDRAVFENVQHILSKKAGAQRENTKTEHILKGILYCGDCKSPMTFRKNRKGQYILICSQYARYGVCKRHQVYEKQCNEMIENALKQMIKKLDWESILQTINIQTKQETKQQKKLWKLKYLQIKLYEDKIKGILSEEEFVEMLEGIRRQKKMLSQENTSLTEQKKDMNYFLKKKLFLIQLIEKVEFFETEQEIKMCVCWKFSAP